MTSEKPDQDIDVNQADDENQLTKTKKPSLWPVLNLIVLLVISTFVIINGYSVRDLKNNTTTAELVNNIESDIEKVSTDVSAINARVQQLESDISLLSTSVEQSNESLEILYSNQNNRDRSVSITEVRHLVNIANLKLKLEANTNLAIVALEEANNRLTNMGDPGLYPIRRQITADINTLKSVPQVDIAGMSFQLSDLIRRINQLPLKTASITGDTENIAQVDPGLPAWRRLLLGVWQEFKSMFIITRTGDGITTSLLPDEKYFLYQNLRLQLESARLAVLRGDAALLMDSLDLAESWLGEYFETSDAAVANAIRIINDLKQQDLEQIIPNIDASLNAIKNFTDENQADNLPETMTIEQL